MLSAAAGTGKIPTVEDRVTHHLKRHRGTVTVCRLYVTDRELTMSDFI